MELKTGNIHNLHLFIFFIINIYIFSLIVNDIVVVVS